MQGKAVGVSRLESVNRCPGGETVMKVYIAFGTSSTTINALLYAVAKREGDLFGYKALELDPAKRI